MHVLNKVTESREIATVKTTLWLARRRIKKRGVLQFVLVLLQMLYIISAELRNSAANVIRMYLYSWFLVGMCAFTHILDQYKHCIWSPRPVDAHARRLSCWYQRIRCRMSHVPTWGGWKAPLKDNTGYQWLSVIWRQSLDHNHWSSKCTYWHADFKRLVLQVAYEPACFNASQHSWLVMTFQTNMSTREFRADLLLQNQSFAAQKYIGSWKKKVLCLNLAWAPNQIPNLICNCCRFRISCPRLSKVG